MPGFIAASILQAYSIEESAPATESADALWLKKFCVAASSVSFSFKGSSHSGFAS